MQGRKWAAEILPEAEKAFEQLESIPGVDILAPMGDLLVNQRLNDEEMEMESSDQQDAPASDSLGSESSSQSARHTLLKEM